MKSATGLIFSLLIVIALIPHFTVQYAESRSLTIAVPGDYSSIQEAINNANVGDTILVEAGTYYENVVVNKSVSLIGEDKYSTIIDGNSSGSAVCVVVDHVTVKGFTVQNGRGNMAIGLGDGVCVCSNGNNISDNIVINDAYCGIRLISTSNNIVTGNYVASNNVGIELSGSDHNTITGNNASSNTYGVRISSGGNNQVWSMDADGSGQTRLSSEASLESYPQWSPDGSKIAYTHTSPCDMLDSEIWVMNPDGTGKTQISTGSAGYFLGGWSPDGSQIAFRSLGIGKFGIWVMDSDGTNEKPLTPDQVGDWNPAWSPDGTKIAFSRTSLGTSQGTWTQDIWIMNPDGTNQTQLTTNIPYASSPSWSPDGSKIAFDSSNYESGTTSIWIMNKDGTNPTKLFSSQSRENCPQWSPDGTKIAYGARDSSQQWDIWVMNADGTNRTRLTEFSGAMRCSWSPDGSKLAFSPWRHLQSTDNNIVGNTVVGNWEIGMTISWDGRRNAVESNVIHSNGHGLTLVQADENVIINNTITNNNARDSGTGIYLDRSRSNILRNNELVDNDVNFLVGTHYPVEQGIEYYYVNDVDESNLVNGRPICYWVNQRDRQVPTNAGCVLLVNSTNILVENLPRLEHNGFGIELYRTSNSTIRNVTASSNLLYGISLLLSSGNNLLNNTATSNAISGIALRSSSGNNLLNNTVTDSTGQAGIMLMSSGNNTLRNNVMERNAFNFGITTGPTVDYPRYDNDVDESNTVDGKPIYYWIDKHNRTVPNDAGLAWMVNCSGIIIKDLTLSNNWGGVGLLNTNGSIVENVTARNCWVGLGVMLANNNTIRRCLITNGVSVFFPPFGMMLAGDYNIVEENTIINMTGFSQYPEPSYAVGFGFFGGRGNRIFHNNFINNTFNAATTPDFHDNLWDDGYSASAFGGNYWGDYDGVDICWGQYQNITTAKDTIGDTPYVVDAGNQDNYPLMLPWINRETPYDCLFLVFGTSMSPTILRGDFIWVKNTTDPSEIFAAPYPSGDIIVHTDPDNFSTYIVRRAVAKWYENGTWFLTVKGDGSLGETNITLSHLVGRVVSLQRPFEVTFKERTFTVYVYSNSTIDDFSFDASGKSICFNATGMVAKGQTSYCNIFIPNTLASGIDDVRIGNMSVPFGYADYIRYSVVTFETNQTAYETTIHASRVGTTPDIAVRAVTAKTVIGQGFCGNFSVEVENQGDFNEGSNVTLSGNLTALQTASRRLAYRSVSTLMLEWNTTGFAMGNYTVSAKLDPLDGEADVSDNTLTDGWVIVAMVGDVTGPEGSPDGRCDMRDIGSVARNFGQTSSPTNMNFDITGLTTGVPDGIIDMRDVGTVARHFGEHYP